MIRTRKIAYNIGFSDALDHRIISAYMSILRWEFDGIKNNFLKKSYFKGFQDGLDIKRNYAIRLQGDAIYVGQPVNSDGSAVATLRSSEFINCTE